jgi:acyl phosphate:glycerol-3-phosphate acyltransferase
VGAIVSWLWAAFAYLCGSIPFGLLIARAASGKDVRTVGSGNIGATNVARAAGKPAAIATLVLDALKGLVPVLLAALTASRPALIGLSGVSLLILIRHQANIRRILRRQES